jgi:hypothetical protein
MTESELRQLADAVALLRRVDAVADGRRAEDEESAFHLLAEANSALRVALADTWLSDDDRDQAETHVWLRRETAERRVFIERHMTADDPAEPANAAELRTRITAQGKRLDEREAATKRVKNALGQIRYHAGQLTKGRPEEAPPIGRRSPMPSSVWRGWASPRSTAGSRKPSGPSPRPRGPGHPQARIT